MPPTPTRSPPDLILLDLNIPVVSGREVLAEVKSAPHLKQIPVIILTTSSDERDVTDTYAHDANCYITKPLI
jgi:CheY-like chemotaxis protein